MNWNINNNLRILVIGDVMIDHYIYGKCNRISPEAPVPVVEVTSESYTLGGAGNVLKNLEALGFKPDVISLTGDDENAKIVLAQLAALAIPTDGIIKDSSRCTIVKSRVLAVNHQLIRLDRENLKPLAANKEEDVILYLESIIDQYELILLSDYNKGLLTPSLLEKVLSLCRQKNIKTIIDPKGLDFSKYKGGNVIKPNKKEAALASGIEITDQESLKKACQKIQDITGCESVIVTMSEEGIAFYSDKLTVIPTKALTVVDVTGAGDTVLASLGAAIVSGNTLTQACDFANHAAAVVVSKLGSATATMKEINDRV